MSCARPVEEDAVPDAAVQFLVQYCASNVELARLSNTCRRWRRIVLEEILWDVEEACHIGSDDDNDDDCNEGNEQGQRQHRHQHNRRRAGLMRRRRPAGWLPVSSLLLPSVMRKVVRGVEDAASGEGNDNDIDTYCLSWFAPEGIQTISLRGGEHRLNRRRGGSDSSDAADGRALHPPNSRPRSAVDQEAHSSTSASSSSSSSSSASSTMLLCPEWRGYRDAHQVLRPFGYSDFFVSAAMQRCHELRQSRTVNGSPVRPVNGSATTFFADSPHHQPTAAVRGATLARPDGYCCCVDLRRDIGGGNNNKRNNNIMSERHQLLRQAVPRVLKRSTNNGASLLSVQFLNSNMAHSVCMVTPPFPAPVTEPITLMLVGIATEDGCFVSGLRRRSVEFGHMYPRTSSESDAAWSAICAATTCPPPPRSRWGGGEGSNDDILTRHSTSSLPYGFSSSDDGMDSGSTSRDDEGDDGGGGEDGSRPSTSMDGNGRCSCPFATVSGKFDERTACDGDDGDDEGDDDEGDDGDDPGQSRRKETTTIYRGVTGPGRWRQYTAIFDGTERTHIRVDGIPEPMDVQLPRAAEPPSRPNHGPWTPALPMQPILDGLTIGSDHCFGMSLCCGYGSGGEGQGAISELVVFKGRLDEADLVAVESHLMKKHGISIPQPASADDRHRDAEWTRQSHLLYNRSCSETLKASKSHCNGTPTTHGAPCGVPLRIMAQHPSVAWQQTHPVTGAALRTQKIGTRPNEAWSSSGGW